MMKSGVANTMNIQLPRSLSLFVIAVATICFGCMAPPWKDVTIGDTGFKAMMPAVPTPFEKEFPSAFGTYKVQFKALTYTYITFTMSVSDFPEGYVKSSTVDTILVSARDAAIAEIKGKLVSEKSITYKGIPGREITYSFGTGKSLRTAIARIYLGGTRLFQVHGAVLASSSYEKDVIRFLDSVEITGTYETVASTEVLWNELVSREGRFKVLAVGSPLFKDTSEEDSELSCYYFNSGGSSYALSWVDVEEARVQEKGPDGILNEFMLVTLDRISGKKLHAESLERNGIKCLEFSFEVAQNNSNYISRCAFYIANNRIYELAVTSPSSLKDLSDVRVFIESFQVLK